MNDANGQSLSVIVPTLNAADRLPACLDAVTAWPGDIQLIVVDGGSEDATVRIAQDHGALVLPAERGRGPQLSRGAAAAQGDWLLFVHADTVLGDGWVEDVRAFVFDDSGCRAAAFRFVLDDDAPQARRVERIVAWRCRVLGLPYGDQGLLIQKDVYKETGGYRPLPLMEDVDLVRRIGRHDIQILETAAVTSADRYRRDGWWARPSRNLFCLFLYICGAPPRWLARLYG